MNSWWETPSCSGFLDRISDEIWSGKVTLVFLPKHSPDGFLSELKKRLEKGDTIQYFKINFDGYDISEKRPIESLLITHFELNKGGESFILRKASSIFQAIDNDPYNVYIFQNIPNEILPEFKSFLIDLGRYFNGIKLKERQKVLVLIDSARYKFDDIIPEPGMVKVKFEGVIDELDQALAIRHYYNLPNNKQKRFPENVIITLSQFDCRLCESLIGCNDLHENYEQQLETFATENEWEKLKYIQLDKLTESEIWDRWAQGILDKVNMQLVYHSAFLKIHKRNDELENRLWLSGIRTLLPLIEEFRWKILMCEKIKFPFKFEDERTGEIKDSKISFEIGDISKMIRSRQIEFKQIPYIEKEKLKGFVELCREIRNDLSHLKMPKATTINKFFDESDAVLSILEN